MSQHDDFNPAKKPSDSDLSATVPDIFASMANSGELPNETTTIKLGGAASLRLPGVWTEQRAGLRDVAVTYKRQDAMSATITVGPLDLDKRGENLIKTLCAGEARALQDFELSALQASLADARRPDKYEISAASTESLKDKIVVVIQGDRTREELKEALIIFPERIGFGQILFKGIRPEFLMYFNHLRHALQTIQWN